MTQEQFNKMVQHDIDFYVEQGQKEQKMGKKELQEIKNMIDEIDDNCGNAQFTTQDLIDAFDDARKSNLSGICDDIMENLARIEANLALLIIELKKEENKNNGKF